MITAALILSAAVLVALYLWDRSKSRQVQRVSNPGATLSDAIDNTLLLVAYASRTGQPLTETDVRTVVVAKRAAAALTETAETAFWLAASSISKTLAPVTIESLISSSPDQLKGKSRAESAATTYMVLTLMTLVALLLFQIYWLIGATVISELKDNRVQLDSLSVEGLASKAAFAALDPKASNFKGSKATGGGRS